jgi:hypothetical protein
MRADFFVIFYFSGSAAQIWPWLPSLDVSRSHTHTHTHARTHALGLPWTSDQLVAEAATYKIYNKEKRRKFKGSVVALKSRVELVQNSLLLPLH